MYIFAYPIVATDNGSMAQNASTIVLMVIMEILRIEVAFFRPIVLKIIMLIMLLKLVSLLVLVASPMQQKKPVF